MSILNAIRQQGSSIDDLSKLPQLMIMGMAQKKQIPAEMVAPILARKAEMADAVARTKSMQNAGIPPTSVMEQLMQRNAAAEQPEPQAREMGVAQLPINEDMYDEQRMAGGGIVAFQNNQYQPVDKNMRREGESENEYMQRVRAVQEAAGQLVNPRNYNPIAKLQDLYGIYDRNIGQPFAAGVKRFTEEPLGVQAEKFRSYAQKPRTEAGIAALAPKTPDSQYEEQGKNAYVSTPIKQPTATATTKAPVAETKAQSALQKVTGAPVMPETKVDPIDALLAKYEKMIQGDPAATAKAKKDAMWSRLAEAGLNIMGGTSSNFAQNVALASPAIKGYGEDIKGLRAEEAAKLTQLAGLGLKGAALKQEARKLGITEKHYNNWLKVNMAQIGEQGATRREAAATRADTATENRILNAAKIIAARPDSQGLSDEELFARAQKLVTGKSAQPTFAGFSGRPIK